MKTMRTVEFVGNRHKSWGEVPAADLVELDVAQEISDKSVMDLEEGTVWLEMDRDFPIYQAAAERAGWEVIFDEASREALEASTECGPLQTVEELQPFDERELRAALAADLGLN